MKKDFLCFLEENKLQTELTEKLITFNSTAYPRFGNIIILAGGAGSGKGFVKDKLIGAEGFVFDVDDLKRIVAKTPFIISKISQELGVDLKKISSNMNNSKNVAKMHEIVNDYLELDDKKLATLYKAILSSPETRKPNIIFDVTLKDLRKLEKITNQVKTLGYNSKNIHIVWVVNDISVAMAQNSMRGRKVPEEILINTHRGVKATMTDILNMGKNLSRYMDGEIVLAFNKQSVDTKLKTSKSGGSYISSANYFYVKRAGSPPTPPAKLSKEIISKISEYTPKNSSEW